MYKLPVKSESKSRIKTILLVFTFGSSGRWKAAVQQGCIFLAASQLIPTEGNMLLGYAAQMNFFFFFCPMSPFLV